MPKYVMLSAVSVAEGGTNEVEALRFYITISINVTCFVHEAQLLFLDSSSSIKNTLHVLWNTVNGAAIRLMLVLRSFLMRRESAAAAA